jgi:hypothetical protein
MFETSPRQGQKFTPDHLAALLARKRSGLTASAAERPESEPPYQGKTVEINGKPYHYEKVPTGKNVWDEAAQARVPGYHSLKSYFSHHTVNVGPGPGWDGRLGLLDLNPGQMVERYGHEFTREEVFNPMGHQDFQTGEWSGGMPDDIPYYALVPDEPHDFGAERAALQARLDH